MEETIELCENNVNTFWCELIGSSAVLLSTRQYSKVKREKTLNQRIRKVFNNLGLAFGVLAIICDANIVCPMLIAEVWVSAGL